jgi:hypothetical protein
MQYFSFISNTYVTSNSLQKSILQFLYTKDRHVIDGKNIGRFQSMIINTINDFNKKHSNCNPIEVYWWEGKPDFKLTGMPGICNFYLYASESP